MWLGIDLGTSGVKTVMMDADQTVVASAGAALTVSRPHPGWSEQEPDHWWTAAQETLDALAKAEPARMAAVRGIGLSGQQHGATLLGANDRPLRPCILWNDGRASEECEILDARADFRGICGNVLMPGTTAPKLEWVRRNEPDVFDQTARVLLPKDYLRLCLTGEALSDMSDSAGTLWMDVAARTWSDTLLAAGGLTEAAMPGLVEGSSPAGRLRPELAARWGMKTAPVLAGGGGDNAASAAGVGAVRPGTGFVSLGTSGVLFVSTDGFAPNTTDAIHAFCHAVPDVWHQMGVILSATDSLNWLARMTGQAPAALTAAVDPGTPAPAPLTFLPYLSGERTPHNDAGARGAFVGIAQSTEVADLTRAVLEGVAYAFADCYDALRSAGTALDRVYAVGGGARSDAWVQIIADATGVPLHHPPAGDFGAAFGAARLGYCAAEGADPLEYCSPAPIDATVTPDSAQAAYHQERLDRYRALYPGARPAMA
ncbi:MAG: xylulokinase [Pseudomonadota bacterium]